MIWNGIELKEITEPQIFNPPEKMVVWDNDTNKNESIVVAILPGVERPVTTVDEQGRLLFNFSHCAKIPEKLKPRRATWKELAYWLMDGKGLVVDENTSRVDTGVFFNRVDLDAEVSDNLKVMRRDDTDWHEPTVDYLGLE